MVDTSMHAHRTTLTLEGDSLAPMSDAELRLEFDRQRATREDRPVRARKSVPEVLEQLEAIDVRLESDGAPVATERELTTGALEDLFANRTCALRVPGFIDTRTCKALTRWLNERELKTWGGTDTSYGAGIPVNALSWSPERAMAYFHDALPSVRALRSACAPGLAPVDKLRLELDELWPAGANVSSDNPYRRKMLVGLARVMRPEGLLDGLSRLEGIVHTDSSMLLDAGRGCFSANAYLKVPAEGGELNIFPLAMKQPEHVQSLVAVVAYLLQHSFDGPYRDRVQRKLHALLPTPTTLRPRAGDLIILNTGRPHAVRGFVRGARVSLQTFVRHCAGRPLQLFS
ncbi:MAG: hypothetical protein IPG50_19670 [Myxococcales bacterium]|nr:hypothetical protein [Myxococcales bacterium]